MHCWQRKIIIIIIIPLQTKYCVRKKIWIQGMRNTCQMHKTQVWMTSLWLWGLICIPFWLRFENVSKNTQIKYIISKPNGFQKHPWQENNMEVVSGSLNLVQLVDRASRLKGLVFVLGHSKETSDGSSSSVDLFQINHLSRKALIQRVPDRDAVPQQATSIYHQHRTPAITGRTTHRRPSLRTSALHKTG